MRREGHAPPCARLAAVLVALALLGLAAACGGERGDGDRRRAPEGTPVVLISVDTLRSDRLPMYGYDGVETPALDALRADSILFEHAFAHVPLTLPSHASLLSGLLPPDHGVRDNLGYQVEAEGRPWLPRLLRENGYATGAAVSAFVLRTATGIGADFDFYEDRILQRSWQLGDAQRSGERTLEASREWLRSVHRGPFFFLFHIYEPHQPLSAPEPFASRFADAYDAEVATADAVVGELLDELRELGVYDRAIVVFLSDHGEGLGEHGLLEHGPLLYREQIQVPLLLKLPDGELGGTSVEHPAQLVDVFPTVAGLLGLEPPEELPGASLVALATGDPGPRTLFGETLFPRVQFGWSELASGILYPYHYIQGPDPELYDLEADPGETRNVIREERRAYASLRDAIAGYDGAYRPPSRVADPEVRARLAALGYLGGAGDAGSASLADPKSKLPVLADFSEGLRLGQSGRHAEAVAVYRRILAQEPQLTTAWEYLGNNLLRLGENEAALEAYRRQMELSAGSSLAALNVAGALLRLGRLDEAEDHALLAAQDYPQALDVLAQIALRQDRLERAEGYVEQLLARDNGQPGPRVTRAEILLRQGRTEEALAQTVEVERMIAREGLDDQLVRGLHLIRGEALAELGRAQEAAEAFRREIEIFPRELAPYTRLAVLFALTGQGPASGQVLRRMVEVNPTPAAYVEAARTMRVLGDPAAAERLLGAARRRWPDSPVLAQASG